MALDRGQAAAHQELGLLGLRAERGGDLNVERGGMTATLARGAAELEPLPLAILAAGGRRSVAWCTVARCVGRGTARIRHRSRGGL